MLVSSLPLVLCLHSSPLSIAEFPSPELSPEAVTIAQVKALQAEDDRRAFRFASPECRRHTCRKQRRAIRNGGSPFYFRVPVYRDLPAYAPIVACERFSLVGSLHLNKRRSPEGVDVQSHVCIVRCWPAGIGGHVLAHHSALTAHMLRILHRVQVQQEICPS